MKLMKISVLSLIIMAARPLIADPAATSTPLPTAAGSDYEITIDGVVTDLTLDQDLHYKTQDGKDITIRVHRKDIGTYKDSMVTFKHPGDLSVSKSDSGSGVEQLVMLTGNGSTLIVQEYAELDTTNIVDFLLDQVDQDDVKAGWHSAKSDITRTLSDGHMLKGEKAILTLGNQKVTVIGLAYSKDSKGIVVVTRLDKDYADVDGKILEDIMKSMSILY